MTLTDALSLLAQALQAIVPAQQWPGVLFGALVYWVVPSRWRLRTLLPISLVVVLMGYGRWPLVPLCVALVGAAVFIATPFFIRRMGHARAVIIGVTVLYCALHGLLGLLTFTSALEFTGVTKDLAIAQCGTVVMFGYLRLIHWIIDQQRRHATHQQTGAAGETPCLGAWQFMSWLLFFPTFTSLPLVRANEFAAMQGATLERRHVVRAIKHAAQVLLKSVLIAVLFTQVPQASAIYSPARFSVPDVWLSVIVNTLIFFLGFTGYVDFALFAGSMLGFNLPDSFARFDKLLQNTRARDFWRDWNYTVTRWLQDYIYTPLGGFRKQPLRNTMLTMLFCGLWHSVSALGAAWGLVLGGMLVTEHWWTRARIKRIVRLQQLPWPVRSAFWLLTFSVAQMAQVPYAYLAENAGGLLRLYARMLGAG